MSVKIRAKNPSNILQTLSCDDEGRLKVFEQKSIHHISLLNHTISSNSTGNVIDLSTYKTLGGTVWGNSDTHYHLVIQYSEDNITYFNIKNINVLNIVNELTFYEYLEIPPKYIRFLNPKNSNVVLNIHLDLII